MTARRFFPVSVCVTGDTGISDAAAIRTLNEIIGTGVFGDGRYGGTSFEILPLDPAQFVSPITENRSGSIPGLPKIKITRDPTLERKPMPKKARKKR